jgi:ribosomal protein S18 acetylase RimI-like enzyme
MTEKPKPLPYYFYKTEDLTKLIHERNEARYWARKFYNKYLSVDDLAVALGESRSILLDNLDSYHAENAELRRQLAIAREALEDYANPERWDSDSRFGLCWKDKYIVREGYTVARKAIEKMDGEK